jgi:hypothetical protein
MSSAETVLQLQHGLFTIDAKTSSGRVHLSCIFLGSSRCRLGCASRLGTLFSADGGAWMKLRRSQYLRSMDPTFACSGFAGKLGESSANLVLHCSCSASRRRPLAISKGRSYRIQAEGSHRRLHSHQEGAAANLCCLGGAPDASLEAQQE